MDPRHLLRVCIAKLGVGAFCLGIAAGGWGAPALHPSYSLRVTALTPATLTAGGVGTSTITVASENGYTGTVTLSCNVTATERPAPTCSISAATVTIAKGRSANATLTVSTARGTPGGSPTISISASDTRQSGASNGSQTLAFAEAARIEHVVVIFQENRTPDNLFQDPVLISRGADIVASGVNSLGQIIPLTPIDLGTVGSNPQIYDLGHHHSDFEAMYDGGKMDGANLIGCAPVTACTPADSANPPQFRYVVQSDVQPYFALAEQYTFGDRMFQSNEGPSFPAHQFIISGTSAPTATSPLFDAENPTPKNLPAGCLGSPSKSRVVMIDAAGSETSVAPEFPCFEHATLTDLLDGAGISWRYYTPSAGSIWTGPVAIQHMCEQQTIDGTVVCTAPDWVNDVIIPQSQVLTDIAKGVLAQVTWIIPDGAASDHASINNGTGPSWVASIVNVIGASEFWANTAIIITWDDWGGWYDHVPPFKVINDGVSWGSGYVYGFRVPLIVVSPYAKRAYISHVSHDFGSILKYIETTFNLPSLGYADTPADDLADCFDFFQPPTSYQAIPAPMDAAHFLNDQHQALPPDDD